MSDQVLEAELPSTAPSPSKKAQFSRVLDRRKQPIRGLWQRNGRFYAQLALLDENGVKVVRKKPLVATTVPEAITAMLVLKQSRDTGRIQAPRRSSMPFNELADLYATQILPGKRPGTIATELSFIKQWKAFLGETPTISIPPSKVLDFLAKKQAQGVTGRTVNLYSTVLKNVLKHGKAIGAVEVMPTDSVTRKRHKAARKHLLSTEDIEKLCTTAIANSPRSGQEFADYIRFLAYSGCRMTEALQVKWYDVDWAKRQVLIGGLEGRTKNNESRYIDFSTKLEAHLKEMHSRRPPDTIWLFPSPRTTSADIPAQSFKVTLRKTAKAAGLPHFKGFHILRHYFVSQCVMSGIDYMTIARWVGHKDGGMLIGKVYGHLTNEHAQLQASKLTNL